MDYEKAYRVALERANIIYCGKYKPEIEAWTKKTLEAIFPELEKDEDERIRDNCVHFLELQKTHHASTIEIDECINWLEKQGKKTQQTPRWMINFLDENRGKFVSSMDYDEQIEAGGKLDAIIDWLEKQGESDETKAKIFLINKGYPIDANGVFPTYEEMFNIIREGFEKQGEQKPTLPKWKYKKDHTPLLRDSIILNKYGCVAKSPSGAIISDAWVLDYDELAKLPKEELEKQGEQKPFDYI